MMRCPICGKDVNPSMGNCIYCGASLLGPRSIDLDLPDNTPNNSNNSNLQKITGININEIPRNETPKNENNSFIDYFKNNKGNLISLIMMILSIILFIACLIIFLTNSKKMKCPNCEICKTKVETKNVGFTGQYRFITPDDYIYTSNENNTLITNNKTNIVLYNPVNYKFSDISQENLINRYKETGYNDATFKSDAISGKTIYYVGFSASDYNFIDFYYAYSDNVVLYGQISSTTDKEITTEVKNIIGTIEIKSNENISVSKATFNYNELFGIENSEN